MKQGELLAITEGVAEFVRGHVGSAMEWTAKRLKELEDRIAAIPAGKDGRDGKDGQVGPAGKNGIDGKDGAQGLQGEKGLDGAAGRDGLHGKDGRDGLDGKDGFNGTNGEPGPAGKDGAPGINGKDGRDGIDGKDGAPGLNGKDGAPGERGRDGKDFDIEQVRGVLEGEVSKWALDFERRAGDLLQRAVDRLPKPKDGEDGLNGKDGADGLGFDDFDVEYDGERTFTFKWVKGERERSKAFKAPVPLYRGTYKASDVYERSDTVTYGGSLWIAQQDNPGTPGDGPTWKLAVRKGVDGKGSK